MSVQEQPPPDLPLRCAQGEEQGALRCAQGEEQGALRDAQGEEQGALRDALVRDLGRQPYEPVWRAMQAFTDARDADTPDELWLVEHEPVFTLGQAGKPEHVLMAGGIPVLHVDRGGQVTYHGPGQVVAYPLLDLKRLKIGVRDYVCRIEQAVIDTLADWNIAGARRDGAPGVYVNGAKIAALGIRVRRGCSFHGLAFNIAGESTAAFSRINPCGYQGLQVVALSDLGGPSSLEAVKPALVAHLAARFGLAMQRGPAPVLPAPSMAPAPAGPVAPALGAAAGSAGALAR